jgi:hypothetical protein
LINTSDPLERLRAVNPVPAGLSTLPAPDTVLFERIVAGETVARPPVAPRRPRRRLVPALLVTSLLGGAVAYAVLDDGVSKPQRVGCYETANLEARTEIVAVDERGPVEACADLWRRGALGRGGEVPPLAQCLLESGVAGVFPTGQGDDVCARLGLGTVPSTATPRSTAPGPGSQADVNDRFLAFRDAVVPQFLATSCMEPRTGAAIVRRELAAAGLGDWAVRGGDGGPADGFSASRPCATLALEPERRQVALVPTPPGS